MPPGWITPARRRSPRIAEYDYALPGTYFVTIRAHGGRCLFGNVAEGTMTFTDMGIAINDCWLAIPRHFPTVALDVHVVMPNHLHGLITLNPQCEIPNAQAHPDLNAVVGLFKSAATRKVNAANATPGLHLWQRSYYDHAVRTEEGLARIREYIANNPIEWELDEYNPERRQRRPR